MEMNYVKGKPILGSFLEFMRSQDIITFLNKEIRPAGKNVAFHLGPKRCYLIADLRLFTKILSQSSKKLDKSGIEFKTLGLELAGSHSALPFLKADAEWKKKKDFYHKIVNAPEFLTDIHSRISLQVDEFEKFLKDNDLYGKEIDGGSAIIKILSNAWVSHICGFIPKIDGMDLYTTKHRLLFSIFERNRKGLKLPYFLSPKLMNLAKLRTDWITTLINEHFDSEVSDSPLAKLLIEHQIKKRSKKYPSDLVAECFILCSIGADPMDQLVSRTLYYLGKNPSMFERFQAEVTQFVKIRVVPENVTQDLVIYKSVAETARLDAPYSLILRNLREDIEVDGLTLRKGAIFFSLSQCWVVTKNMARMPTSLILRGKALNNLKS